MTVVQLPCDLGSSLWSERRNREERKMKVRADCFPGKVDPIDISLGQAQFEVSLFLVSQHKSLISVLDLMSLDPLKEERREMTDRNSQREVDCTSKTMGQDQTHIVTSAQLLSKRGCYKRKGGWRIE